MTTQPDSEHRPPDVKADPRQGPDQPGWIGPYVMELEAQASALKAASDAVYAQARILSEAAAMAK